MQAAWGPACAPEEVLGAGRGPGEGIVPVRTSNDASRVPCLPTAEHVTMIGQRPGVVRLPTRQVQVTMPRLSAVFGTRPLALLGPDLYCTVIRHRAPGVVCTVIVASLPGLTGDVTETRRTGSG